AARQGLIRSERLAALGRLSAGLAQEIGNPLGALMGFVELALATGSREAIEGVGVQAQRIHRTVQELMDFARPGRMEVGQRYRADLHSAGSCEKSSQTRVA